MRPLPRRWRHVEAVGRKAERISGVLPLADQEPFIVAAWLHDVGYVRRSFRAVVKAAGLDRQSWTPREMRHSFVSLMSDSGVTLEDIADLCGHASTQVTETVYRHQLRPVILAGAEAMDSIFGEGAKNA